MPRWRRRRFARWRRTVRSALPLIRWMGFVPVRIDWSTGDILCVGPPIVAPVKVLDGVATIDERVEAEERGGSGALH